MNDDIWFDWKYLKNISNFITENVGMIGMGYDNYSNPTGDFRIVPVVPYPESRPMYISSKIYRTPGYGCCFFIHKNNWDN